MIFGEVSVEEAVGSVAAHAIRIEGASVRKGRVVSAEAAEALRNAGIARITVARLEADDIGEDAAAHALATALAGEAVRVEPPFTGRANLFAAEPGLLLLDPDRIDAINAQDEAITVATLPAFKPVVAGEMVGTVKIIPYAVAGRLVRAALRETDTRPVAVAPYRVRRVAAVSTVLPGLKRSTIAKTVRVLGDRLAPAGAIVAAERTCPHATDTLRVALTELAASDAELIVVFGASAIADRRDVIPAAIEAAGGRIVHFGMPVDPGNLLLLGELESRPVLGAPGCARSPAENGFDWILARLLCGLPVSARDITRLGVGGLLMEIGTRGQPRAAPDETG